MTTEVWIEQLSHVLQVWGLSYHVVGFGINPWIQAMCSYTEENERGPKSTQYSASIFTQASPYEVDSYITYN